MNKAQNIGRYRVVIILLLLYMTTLSAQFVDISAQISNDSIFVTYIIPENHHQLLQKEFFNFSVKDTPGLVFGETIYPDAPLDENGIVEYYNSVTLVQSITRVDTKIANSLTLKADYQLCNEAGACLFPVSVELEVATDGIGDAKEIPVKKEKHGLIHFFIFAFLGGLILNVMPCVLPVLSIRAMSLVNQQDKDDKYILKSALIYTLGVIVSFIILALVIIILKVSGESVGWGFQFQSPVFILALISIIYIFALSLFDVFIIRAPGMNIAYEASNKSGLTGMFFSGVFAVLLATPCTAPLLGASLGYAFSQPPAVILILFILIGLGLAFPFLLLGFFPKAIKLIPKPGNWMNIFKEIMGFLLLATVIYLLRSLYFLVGGLNIINTILFLLIISFSAWLYGRFSRPEYSIKKQWIMSLIALIVLIFGAIYTLDFAGQDNIAQEKVEDKREQWETFSPDLLQQYRLNDQPVFIEFYAEWCLTCKGNRFTVLMTDDIEKAFADKGVKLLAGDNTRKNPLITEWLNKFGRAGVPLYVFYLPGQEEPVVLPEVITKDIIYKVIDKL